MSNILPIPGSTSDAVALLHSTLQRISFRPPTTEVSEKTYGSGTQQAVQQFQQQQGLPATGTVDEQTAAN